MSEIDNKLTLIQVLVQGQTFAKQLQILLGEPVVREDGFAASQLFVDQILTSFSESIDRINHQLPNENQTKGRGRRRRRSNSSDHHPYSCGGSTENRHDSRPSLTQDKRGCYKRRSLETRTKVSPTPEDGQAWRKYGQKIILNSKFPRSYFRCTHKFDQGCKATKQVQIMEENPQLYQITYIGFHTCGDTLKGPTLFVSSETDPNPQDVVVSRRRVDFSTISSSPQQSVAVKEEEHKEQDTKSDLTDNINSFPHPDIMDLELSNSVSQMYSCFGALEDVTSQFDHPDFQIDNFFLGVDDEGHLTPHL